MKKVIAFHYTLTDDSGKTLDSSAGQEPLYFLEGIGQIIPGLETELLAMIIGQKKKVTVLAKDAYGDVNPELVVKVAKSQFPEGANLQIGDQFQVSEQDGLVFTITKFEADQVFVDGNHPLAGKNLTFDVELMESRAATAEEISHGHAHGPHGHHHH
jgi:FKBP-type peptidyl-prolyl cis-trans isomerase SlyD